MSFNKNRHVRFINKCVFWACLVYACFMTSSLFTWCLRRLIYDIFYIQTL